MMMQRRTALTALGATAVAGATARAAEPKYLGGKLMFMVRRTYAEGKDIAALRTPAEPAHQQHLLKFGQTVIASAILGPGGTRIGSVSISDINTRAEIESYVYDDPFTKAGIYGSITITPVDLYKVDGSYNRAPAWFAPELQRRQQAAGYDVPVLPTGNRPAKPMYLVRRTYIAEADFNRRRAAAEQAHRDYLLANSITVISAAVLDDAGMRVGDIAVCDIDDRAAAERYVRADPFATAGMFAALAFEQVDLYKLDGSYNRAPGWFADEMKRRQDARATPAKG
ncbi:MAG: hypothetical protein SFV21_19840 [Rhodospirillaceae bacterium]|nr:hypothetical protein [Rhodospirillaceae bacterium]